MKYIIVCGWIIIIVIFIEGGVFTVMAQVIVIFIKFKMALSLQLCAFIFYPF